MRVDSVQVLENKIGANEKKASRRIPLRGRRARHDVQDTSSNSGDPYTSLFFKRVWQTTQ